MDSNLGYAVLNLHNIARSIEQSYGQSELTITLRECADKLNELIVAKQNEVL